METTSASMQAGQTVLSRWEHSRPSIGPEIVWALCLVALAYQESVLCVFGQPAKTLSRYFSMVPPCCDN